MKYLIGVSKSLLSDDQNDTFWCTYPKYKNKPGDLFAFYIKRKGICQFYSLDYIDRENPQINCDFRSMFTIRINHILTIDNPLSYGDMNEDENLREMGAFRKRFQGTTFLISEFDWDCIIYRLSLSNPQSAQFLQELKIAPNK